MQNNRWGKGPASKSGENGAVEKITGLPGFAGAKCVQKPGSPCDLSPLPVQPFFKASRLICTGHRACFLRGGGNSHFNLPCKGGLNQSGLFFLINSGLLFSIQYHLYFFTEGLVLMFVH